MPRRSILIRWSRPWRASAPPAGSTFWAGTKCPSMSQCSCYSCGTSACSAIRTGCALPRWIKIGTRCAKRIIFPSAAASSYAAMRRPRARPMSFPRLILLIRATSSCCVAARRGLRSLRSSWRMSAASARKKKSARDCCVFGASCRRVWTVVFVKPECSPVS